MNNDVQQQLNDIHRISTEIAIDLQNQTVSDDVIDKMIQRGQWIITLVESSSIADKGDILQKLMAIRDKENKILIPHRKTVQTIKETLVKLKQTTGYLKSS